jgi:hypothetical protein
VQSAGSPASRIHLRLTEMDACKMHDIVKSFNTNRVQSCYLSSRYYVSFGVLYAKWSTLACISYIRLRQISRTDQYMLVATEIQAVLCYWLRTKRYCSAWWAEWWKLKALCNGDAFRKIESNENLKQTSALQIVMNKQLENVEYCSYLGSIVTNDAIRN